MSAPDDLTRFIGASFRSVWSLELLLLLRREPDFHHEKDLVAKLRASQLVVQQALHGLIAGGLAVMREDGQIAFMPASAELAEQVERTAELYARKPDTVRRVIVRAGAPGLAAFSDAFLWRKE